MPTPPAAPPDAFRARLAELVARFDRHRDQYLKASYNETEARAEFIDPLFEALGWDVRNTAGAGPTEREVIRESGRTVGRVDYAFRVEAQPRFFVEAKAPHVPLERSDVIMQAKSYAWNTKDVFVAAVTDFEEFRLYDASLKPDPKHPDAGLIFAYRCGDYLTPAALGHLWELSREAVRAGSLDRLLKLTAREKRQRIPVDQAFLADLTAWREQLAKAVYKAQPGMDAADLNSAVQVFLDRLIFIRIAEDRGVLPPRGLKEIVEAWGYSGKRRPLTGDLNALFREVNDRLNGEIFKPHHSEKIAWDAPPLAALVAGIIAGLYFPNCPYRFDVIGVELLGSIYERYLGKTIRVTEKRAIVEDKPEVRKAGGVYYTPRYIVDYIVAQTVGKLIEGKTPAQIAKLKILDPACGSGSFLLGAYQRLLDYHLQWHAGHARGKGASAQPALIADADSGEVRLTLAQKAEILRNNLYGVDIDPQAVEITTMSLYIKLLEGERGAITGTGVLPRLGENIKCGNSLISTLTPGPSPLQGEGSARSPSPHRGEGRGEGRQLSLLPSADLSHLRPFNWESEREGFGPIMKAGGFDAVIGNPPYIRMEEFKEIKPYLRANYQTHSDRADIFYYFVEKATTLLKSGGRLGFILSNTFARSRAGTSLRSYISTRLSLLTLVEFGDFTPFAGATVYPLILIAERAKAKSKPVAFVLQDGDPSLAPPEKQFSILFQLEQSSFGEAAWVFDDPKIIGLRSKLLSQFPSLRGSYGEVCMGIKSGLNEAFLLSNAGRKKILAANPEADTVIKPYVGGRNLDHYHCDWEEEWMIYTPHGIDMTPYPAVLEHLRPFKSELQKRATQQAWYELQQPQEAYAALFEKPKIIFPDISRYPKYSLDTRGLYFSNTVYFISSDSLYLLGLLNSKLLWFIMRGLSNALRGGMWRFRLFSGHVERLPIRRINFSDPADKARHDRMVGLVEHMLALHKRKAEAKSESLRAQLEREINVTDEQIDGLVYELYGLSEDEIRIAEGKT